MDGTDRYQQLLSGVETVNWIQGAGKDSRVRMFADSVLKEQSDQKVNMYYVGALVNALEDIDSEVIINDLPTLIKDEEHPIAYEEYLHPLQEMTQGEANVLVAMTHDAEFRNQFIYNRNPVVRLAAAATTRDPSILENLSYDPCVLVRTAVAVNDSTASYTKDRLRRDPFWHVQRRTLYGNSDAVHEFDKKRKLIDSGEIEPENPDFWPIDCACVDDDFAYEYFNEVFHEDRELYVPNVPDGLAEKMREFDSWYWGTQPFPSPESDYLIASVEYLKTRIPDQYAVNHWGHGINSYGLNLRIAIGNLAIMGQVGWYGAYNDSQECRNSWDSFAREINELIQGRERKYSPEFRMRDFLIVYSDFRLSKPQLWIRNGSEWELKESVQTLSDIAKIVNKV